ncbi:LOW QUALITY PROTEIN: hypothetical protein U0070_017226, partial [Myodes glareolus]
MRKHPYTMQRTAVLMVTVCKPDGLEDSAQTSNLVPLKGRASGQEELKIEVFKDIDPEKRMALTVDALSVQERQGWGRLHRCDTKLSSAYAYSLIGTDRYLCIVVIVIIIIITIIIIIITALQPRYQDPKWQHCSRLRDLVGDEHKEDLNTIKPNSTFPCRITMVAGTLYSYPENLGHLLLLSAVGLGSTCSPYHSTSTLVKLTVPLPELLYKIFPNKVLPFEGNSRFCQFHCLLSKEELWRSNPGAAAHGVSFVNRNMIPPGTQKQLGVPTPNPIWASCTTANRPLEMQRRRGYFSLHALTSPSYGCHGEVKLCEKMAQFDTKNSQPQKDTQRKENDSEEKKNPLAKWKEEKKAAATAPEGSWMNVSKNWLLSPRPRASSFTCPRVSFCWMSLSRSAPMKPPSLSHCGIVGSTWIRMAGPCEFVQPVMSCNHILGMYQRLDKWGKNALPSATLFGTNNNSSVS